MSNPFYITTPIYYVNAKPHLGHAYTTITADVMCKFQAMKGKETFLLTGTDEHGDKIVEAANKENLTPKTYADNISMLFQNLCADLGIDNNDFIRTTEPRHIQIVMQILQKIYDSGDIYFSEYKGLYCFGCERFYTEKELVDGKCPDHKTEPEIIKESNYFFKMSKYQNWLLDHIKNNPDFIRPERYKNEVISFLQEPLEDLCISRPKSRLKWGITLPFDNNYVTYVWFDALLNYVSALQYPDGKLFHKFWSNAQHIVAKDILKPHGIYWPTMLKAAGIPVYKHLNVHGYWNYGQDKMSKSLGNVIEPVKLKENYGLDQLRFFLMRDMVFGLDSNFLETAMVQRINSELANDLGNLFSRTITMVHKYFDGVVPQTNCLTEKEFGADLKSDAMQSVEEFEAAMDSFAFHKALMSIWSFINKMNKYIDITTPWTLAKKRATEEQLKVVLYNLLESLRIVSGMLYPVMPAKAAEMQKHLGLDPEEEFYLLDNIKKWRILPYGTKLPKVTTLFPRIDLKTINSDNENKQTSSPADSGFKVPEIKPEISFEEFRNVDLRVATIIRAEKIKKSKKLLKLEVDIGEKRTIVAGISQSYDINDIIGKQVIIAANLKPAKLMGVLSNGMVLAGTDDSQTSVITVDRKVKPGTILN